MKTKTLSVHNRNWIKLHTKRKDHKKMYKAKKQWVVASIAMLGFTGGYLAINTNAHADTVPRSPWTENARSSNSGYKQPNPEQRSQQVVQRAHQVTTHLVANFVNNSNQHRTSPVTEKSSFVQNNVGESETNANGNAQVDNSNTKANHNNIIRTSRNSNSRWLKGALLRGGAPAKSKDPAPIMLPTPPGNIHDTLLPQQPKHMSDYKRPDVNHFIVSSYKSSLSNGYNEDQLLKVSHGQSYSWQNIIPFDYNGDNMSVIGISEYDGDDPQTPRQIADDKNAEVVEPGDLESIQALGSIAADDQGNYWGYFYDPADGCRGWAKIVPSFKGKNGKLQTPDYIDTRTFFKKNAGKFKIKKYDYYSGGDIVPTMPGDNALMFGYDHFYHTNSSSPDPSEMAKWHSGHVLEPKGTPRLPGHTTETGGPDGSNGGQPGPDGDLLGLHVRTANPGYVMYDNNGDYYGLFEDNGDQHDPSGNPKAKSSQYGWARITIPFMAPINFEFVKVPRDNTSVTEAEGADSNKANFLAGDSYIPGFSDMPGEKITPDYKGNIGVNTVKSKGNYVFDNLKQAYELNDNQKVQNVYIPVHQAWLKTNYILSDGTKIGSYIQNLYESDLSRNIKESDPLFENHVPAHYEIVDPLRALGEFNPYQDYTTNITVKPIKYKQYVPVELHLEGHSPSTVYKIDTQRGTWGTRFGHYVINGNDPEYHEPYYELDTSHPTKYTGTVNGTYSVSFSPALPGGFAQFWLKPVTDTFYTEYLDDLTNRPAYNSSIKPIFGSDYARITPRQATTKRGSDIPEGYHLVTDQNQEPVYTFSKTNNRQMINIRVMPNTKTGTVTINRFVKVANGPYKEIAPVIKSVSDLTYTRHSNKVLIPSDFTPAGYRLASDKSSDNQLLNPQLNADGTIANNVANYYYETEPSVIHVVYLNQFGKQIGIDPNLIPGKRDQSITVDKAIGVPHVPQYVPIGYHIISGQPNTSYTFGHDKNINVYTMGNSDSDTFTVKIDKVNRDSDTKTFSSDYSPSRVFHITGHYKLPTGYTFKASDFVPKGYVKDPNFSNLDVTPHFTKHGKLNTNTITYHYVTDYTGTKGTKVAPIVLYYVNKATGKTVGWNLIHGYLNQVKTADQMADDPEDGGRIPKGYNLYSDNTQSSLSGKPNYKFGLTGGKAIAYVYGDTIHKVFIIRRWYEHSDGSKDDVDVLKYPLSWTVGQQPSSYTFSASDPAFLPHDLQVDPTQSDDQKSIHPYIDNQGNVVPKDNVNFYYQKIPAKPVVIKYMNDHSHRQIGNLVVTPGYKDEVRSKFNLASRGYYKAGIPTNYTIQKVDPGNYKFSTKKGGRINVYLRLIPVRINIPRVLEYPDGGMRGFDNDADFLSDLDSGQEKVYFANNFTPEGYIPDPNKRNQVKVYVDNNGNVDIRPHAFYYVAQYSNQPGANIKSERVDYLERNGKLVDSAVINGYIGENIDAPIVASIPANFEIDGNQKLNHRFNDQKSVPIDVYVKPINDTVHVSQNTSLLINQTHRKTYPHQYNNYTPEIDIAKPSVPRSNPVDIVKPAKETKHSERKYIGFYRKTRKARRMRKAHPKYVGFKRSEPKSRVKYAKVHRSKDRNTKHRTSTKLNHARYSRWIYSVKPFKIYASPYSRHSISAVIRPSKHLSFKVIGTVRYKGRVRYAIRYHGQIGYVNVNHRQIRNAYYTRQDWIVGRRHYVIVNHHGHSSHKIRVIKLEYNKRKGTARFVLNNGRYITANKNYVKLI